MCRAPAINARRAISISSRRSRSGRDHSAGRPQGDHSRAVARLGTGHAQAEIGTLVGQTPIKLAITITPDLNEALRDYALPYAASYGMRSRYPG
ncbi:DUF2274 domain-containing protein [Sphingomonas sp. SRS2]|uniref:DUF2274 domain-containing protein n=1 Tax=Sphingomonas sp. SRS2 TaxID=133190 RepID=UPI003FA7A1A8